MLPVGFGVADDAIAEGEVQGRAGRRLQAVPEQVVLGEEDAGLALEERAVVGIRLHLPRRGRGPVDDPLAIRLLPQRIADR
jgi:hypothetical protein